MKPTRPRSCPTCSKPISLGRGTHAYCSDSCRPTCAVDGCITTVTGSKSDLCALHQSRRRDGRPDWRTCTACGVLIEDRPRKSRVCEAHNQCSVDGCRKPICAKGLCSKHVKHSYSYGSPYATCKTCTQPIDLGPGQWVYCSDRCRPTCLHPTCDKPVRGADDVCSSHQVQRSRHGELKPDRWAKQWVCLVCGKDVERGSGRRKYCSANCQQMEMNARRAALKNGAAAETLLNAGGIRPRSFECVQCGANVSLLAPSAKSDRTRRSDSKMCHRCARRPRRYGITVDALARRDGRLCGICKQPVDMEATGRDRPSVDHIWPRSRGGTDDPANLQLAHLGCNMRKSNKIDEAV